MAGNDPLQSAVEALTEQLRTLNMFQQKAMDRASQSRVTGTGASTGTSSASMPIDPRPSQPQYEGWSGSGAPPWSVDTATGKRTDPATGEFLPPMVQGPGGEWVEPSAAPPPRVRPGAPSGSASTSDVPHVLQQRAGDVSSTASVPVGVTVPWGSGLVQEGQASMFGGGTGNAKEDEQRNNVLTMAMLGEHGAPSLVRNTMLGMYGIQSSINWAQKGASYLADPNNTNVPTVIQNMANPDGRIGSALNSAMKHPVMAYMGVRGLQAVGGAAGAINDHLSNMQNLGGSLGFESSGALPYAVFGHRTPFGGGFSAAAGEGASIDLARLRAEGITGGVTGITHDQATAASDILVNQGFSNAPVTASALFGGPGSALGGGNENTIMQNLMVPILKRFPQLDPQVIAQFTGSLRNAGASVETVRNQISDFGAEAHASQMSLNDFAKAVATTGGQFESMGSSFAGGASQAQALTNITGISGAPEMAGQLAQNPMVQGMALGQYGVLPSGLGDMNAGALAGTEKTTAQMLNHALAGIDHNVYRNINGVRTLVANGGRMRTDQIASMLGIPSNQVQAWLNPGDQSRQTARTNLSSVVGSEATHTGLWAQLDAATAHGRKMNASQLATFNRDWGTGVDAHLANSGISQRQIHGLDAIKDPRRRLTQMEHLLANTSATAASTVQKRDDTQTVKLQFTGAAAAWFQQLNTGASSTPAKKIANAGGVSYAHVLNSATGDPNSDLRLGRFVLNGR